LKKYFILILLATLLNNEANAQNEDLKFSVGKNIQKPYKQLNRQRTTQSLHLQ